MPLQEIPDARYQGLFDHLALDPLIIQGNRCHKMSFALENYGDQEL